MTEQTLQKELDEKQVHPLRKMLQDATADLDKKRAEKFNRIAYSFVRANPEITKCEPKSLLGAFLVCAQLDLEPVAGQAYILPFFNKRQINGEWKTLKEAQFILGYRGLSSLFYRHEKAVQLSWGIVHQNDDFDYEYGTSEKLRHKPLLKDRGLVMAYYVIAKLANGGTPFMVMPYADCVEHGRKHSKTFDKSRGEFYPSSPWKTAEDSMCLKTVLIQLGKLLPLSVETQRAIQADETSRDFREGIPALDLPVTTTWDIEPAVELTTESKSVSKP